MNDEKKVTNDEEVKEEINTEEKGTKLSNEQLSSVAAGRKPPRKDRMRA